MNALVVYSTKTKNTLKLAEALYEALRYTKELKSITDNPNPDDYDFIAVGYWVKDSKPDPATMEFLPKIRDGQQVFLFATHASARDSGPIRNAMKIAKELTSKGRIVGTFGCQGEVSPEMMEKLAAQDKKPGWFADAPAAKGHPDEQDIAELVHLINTICI